MGLDISFFDLNIFGNDGQIIKKCVQHVPKEIEIVMGKTDELIKIN